MPQPTLAKAIADLRSELLAALVEGEGKPLRFKLKPVELEFKVGITWDGDIHAGVKFWVIDMGGKGQVTDEQTHTLKLVLEPVGTDGQSEFIVSGTGRSDPTKR